MAAASLRSVAGDDAALCQKLSAFVGTLQSPNGQRAWREEGVGEFVFEVLRDAERSEEVHATCWDAVTEASRLSDADREKKNAARADYSVEQGALRILARELALAPPRPDVLRFALAFLTGICLLPHHTKAVLDAQLVSPLLRIISNEAPQLEAIYALICIANLAIDPSTHEYLSDVDAIDTVEPLLEFLESEDDDDEIDCGLTASFIICRLSASDENSESAKLVRSNSKIIEMLCWILNEITWTNGPVLGSYWNPANVVLDVSILASSPQIRSLMKPFVTLIGNVLEKKSKNNKRLVDLSLKALNSLAKDETCKAEIINLKESLAKAVEKSLRLNPEATANNEEIIKNLKALLLTKTESETATASDDSIPPGHTAFSWSSPGYQVGLGHTSFSWGN